MLLGRRYAHYINRTHQRTGTLWDSRYKFSVVHADGYPLSCMRYIELYPVRVALVDDLAHYRWTGYCHNGLGQANSHIAAHLSYSLG